jgi:NADH-quinone oxidoreductase subunit A
MQKEFIPVLLQIILVIGFGVATLLVSKLLGKSTKSNVVKDTAYECGMLPLAEGQPRFSVKFYIVAMLFVLFDIEVVFLYPASVVYVDFIKEIGLGIAAVAMGFISLLGLAFVYAWRKGVLDWK